MKAHLRKQPDTSQVTAGETGEFGDWDTLYSKIINSKSI